MSDPIDQGDEVMPKTIILADGMSVEGHLEDRHFIRIGGEPLLPRTVRQFAAFSDVVVLASDRRYAERLSEAPCKVVPGDGNTVYSQADMIRKGLIHRDNPATYLVFGDTYFTDSAIGTIASGDYGKAPMDWAVYGRSTDNKFTGTPWAEFFVIELGRVSTIKCKTALDVAYKKWSQGKWPRCSVWEWYYHMERMSPAIADVKNVPTGKHWVEINDLTDDIDFRADAANLHDAVERMKGGE